MPGGPSGKLAVFLPTLPSPLRPRQDMGSSVINTQAPRSHLAVTLGVWRALILREAEAKLFASRVSWVWVLLEPVFQVGYLIVLYTAIRVHKVGDLDTAMWLMVGLQAYFIFRKTSDRVTTAATDNSALYAYRQVKPIDTLIARALLEGATNLVTLALLSALLLLFGHVFYPEFPLGLLRALLGMWTLGLGFGMTISAISAMVAEIRLVLQVVIRPLYLISGIIFPIGSLSKPYREILMLNPVAHGVEMARQSLSQGYEGVPETDPAYLFLFATILLLVGLVLQLRFAMQIAER